MTRILRNLCMCIGLLIPSVILAAEEPLRMVTATGRAAIGADEMMDAVRNRALEDALYLAALSGGAKIDGFTSVQANTAIDDHFVVRPSTEILDYNITNETYDDTHYEVSIQAALGNVHQTGCHRRMVGQLSIFAPKFYVVRNIPGWMTTLPPQMLQQLLANLQQTENIFIENEMSTKLDPAFLMKDRRYSYTALTSRVPKVLDGDFAFETDINFGDTNAVKSFGQDKLVEVTMTSRLYKGSQFESVDTIATRTRVKIGQASASEFIDALNTPKRAKLRGEFLQVADAHAKAIIEAVMCAPLRGVVTKKDGGLHVSIGSRQRIKVNQLAVVSGQMTPWSILRVIKTGPDGAVLMPLNKQRDLATLDGKQATFLEVN